MEIIVVFEKVHIEDITGTKEIFTKRIGEIAQTLNQCNGATQIHVQLLEGKLPDSSENRKVLVLIYTEEAVNNLGALIVDFKYKVMKIFEENDVNLDKNSLEIRLNPQYSVNKLMSEFRKAQRTDEPCAKENDEFDYEQKAKQYIPVEPLYSFERVILPKDIIEKIQEAVGILECENKVFKEWGLYEIQPHPSTALSFFGPSGTGKTMAAEAIAQKLGKKILKVSYADVESKYHGEGPKMVKAIFLAATKANAVLFFDEADSLLSKRLTSVTQGSEQAINSMRSQLLICLEEFMGIVIFATNLVVNYDQAFLTRLISVEFKLPDAETRKAIWNVHIKAPNDDRKHQLNIPLAEDVNTVELSEKYELVGREIRNAVVSACVKAALEKRDVVTQKDFTDACDKIIQEQKALSEAKDHTKVLRKGDAIFKEAVLEKMKNKTDEGDLESLGKT